MNGLKMLREYDQNFVKAPIPTTTTRTKRCVTAKCSVALESPEGLNRQHERQNHPSTPPSVAIIPNKTNELLFQSRRRWTTNFVLLFFVLLKCHCFTYFYSCRYIPLVCVSMARHGESGYDDARRSNVFPSTTMRQTLKARNHQTTTRCKIAKPR